MVGTDASRVLIFAIRPDSDGAAPDRVSQKTAGDFRDCRNLPHRWWCNRIPTFGGMTAGADESAPYMDPDLRWDDGSITQRRSGW